MAKLAETLKNTQAKIEQEKQSKATNFFNKTLKPFLKKYAKENSNSNCCYIKSNIETEKEIFYEISEHMNYLEDTFEKQELKVKECKFPGDVPGFEISW